MNPATIEGFQMSAQQLHLWKVLSLDQSPSYRVQFTIVIDGSLEIDTLRQAVEGLVSRHEILRTSLRRFPGMAVPVQVIAEPEECAAGFDFNYHDAGDNGHDNDSLRLAAETFDLENGPLVRGALRRTSPTRHTLTVEVSSFCADSTTARNLAEELARAYEAISKGEELTDAPMQYADYAAWQAETLKGEGAGEEFWAAQARSGGREMRLPFERAPGSRKAFAPRVETMSIESPTAAALDRLALDLECSVSELLLASWMILLGRLTNQPELSVAARFDGRGFPELQAAAGSYARFLPIGCRFEEENSVGKFVEQLRTIMRRAYEWQECFAWEKVESVANTPAFVSPVAFDFIELPPALSAGGITMTLDSMDACVDRFGVKLTCVRQGDSLTAELHYDEAVCGSDDAQRLLEEFVTVAGCIAARPGAKLGEVEILGARERQLVTRHFNRTERKFSGGSIHALIDEQVKSNPEALAAVWRDESLSYSELNRRANHLGARLQKCAVGPDVPVAICAESSLEMLVAILGVLKAGGGYVPLDPGYPQERLSFILQDTHAPVLLTTREVKTLPFAGEVIYLDDVCPPEPDQQWGIPLDKAQPESTAYIIYTSGSTGKPKGVPISHRNLVHSTTARMTYYEEKVGSYLLLSSFSFDSSVAGLFWTLCQGGKLVLPSDRAHQDPVEIGKLVATQGVTHLLCLPSLYRHVLEADPKQLASLRTVIVAGESCPVELVERHRQRLPGVALFNEYGPTEGTVWSTVFDCRDPLPGRCVPIGRPISNMNVYILDSAKRPLPVNVTGEIYIGGEGVAAGYLNRPELTFEKFVPDPFGGRPGARLYRTGDLGRFLPDGNLEFFGRADQQVKLRGYRIELEEIESVLRQHPGIREAVAAVKGETGANGDRNRANLETLAERLEQLEPQQAEALLSEIEANEPESNSAYQLDDAKTVEPVKFSSNGHVDAQADHWIQRSPMFDVTLDIKEPGFIKPPRETQRTWLINRALAELSEDLTTLDKLAGGFVPGVEFGIEEFKTDRTQAALADDEIIQDWHAPLMKAMAEAITVSHGDILEIGFGRGMAATFLQRCGVRSHTVIECNDYVIERHFAPWRKDHPAVRLVRGKWQDVIGQLQAFDGIFFQTYPLNEREFIEYLARSVTFAEHFFPTAVEHLRPGGALTYLSHEIDSLSRRHQRLIFKYFRSLEMKVEHLQLPIDCRDLWWSDSMVVVKAIK